MSSSTAPGRIVQTRIACIPGTVEMGEVVLDASRDVWARWRGTDSTWGKWTRVGSGAADADITLAAAGDAFHVTVTPGAPSLGRTAGSRLIHTLSAAGVAGTNM